MGKSNIFKNHKIKNIVIFFQGVIILLLLMHLYSHRSDDYTQLARYLNTTDLNEISMRLDDFSIEYKIEENSIFVDKKDLELSWLIISDVNDTKSYLSSLSQKYSLVKKKNDMSDEGRLQYINSVKEIAIQDALENGVDYIESAKLHLNKKKSNESGDIQDTNIILILTIKKDYIMSQNDLENINHYLINSVENLSKEQIRIFNDNGVELK